MSAAPPRSPVDRLTGPSRLATVAARLSGELPALPALDPTSTCGDAVTAALTRDVRRLLEHIGPLPTSDDAEVLHQARVGLRRLRTDLRTLRPLLDPHDTDGLSAELAWLGTAIGAVRDHDVFVDVLAGYARRAPDEVGMQRLVDGFAAKRPMLLGRLTDDLVSDRTLAALTAITTVAIDPPLLAMVDEPAAALLTDLARRPWRKLVRRARELDAESPVDELHDLRIRVKKARYAAEVASAVRPDAADHVRTLARLQATLGDINDATITIHRLRDAVEQNLASDQAYAAGVVTTMERRRIDERRVQWPGRWDLARRKRVRGWLDSSG